MELSRRDAVAALAALGAGGIGAAGVGRYTAGSPPSAGAGGDADGGPAGDRTLETYAAVAEVVYPAEVSGIGEFLESFLPARLERESHGPAMRETVAALEARARTWHGAPVAGLSPETRDRLLREVGADTAEEDPDGTFAERTRYYVVNELLLALYASPAGGKLVGIENPQGHPGGTTSYRQGPPDASGGSGR